MKKVILTIALALAFIGSVSAQDSRASGLRSTKDGVPTTVTGGKTTINSNLKSRGFIGPYEIIAHRERGLFGPSTVETFVFDIRTGDLVVINPANSAGIGVAIVNGGAAVGSSYLFGSKLRPDNTSVNSGSASTATASGSGSATGSGGNTGGSHNHGDNNHNH